MTNDKRLMPHDASHSWGKPPDAHRFATAALSPLASPLLPKGEASAKGEDRAGSPMPNDLLNLFYAL